MTNSHKNIINPFLESSTLLIMTFPEIVESKDLLWGRTCAVDNVRARRKGVLGKLYEIQISPERGLRNSLNFPSYFGMECVRPWNMGKKLLEIWKNKTCSKPLTRFNTNPSNTLFLYHSKPSGNIPGAFSGAGKTRIQRPFQAVPRDKTIQWWANLEWRVNQMYMNIQSICFEYISKECESIFSDLLILWVASPNGRLSNGNIPNHFQQIQDLELTCIWNVS